jgi:TPR repeat protein
MQQVSLSGFDQLLSYAEGLRKQAEKEERRGHIDKAVFLLKKSAWMENAESMWSLWTLFKEKHLQILSANDAFYWLERAATKGHELATLKIAEIYKEEEDYPLAFWYFWEVATNHKTLKAYFELGVFYMKGLGKVKKNEEEAKKYFNLCKDEIPEAKNMLAAFSKV